MEITLLIIAIGVCYLLLNKVYLEPQRRKKTDEFLKVVEFELSKSEIPLEDRIEKVKEICRCTIGVTPSIVHEVLSMIRKEWHKKQKEMK